MKYIKTYEGLFNRKVKEYELTDFCELYLKDQGLTKLNELPKETKIFKCSGNNLQYLPELPVTLETLDCSDNELIELPELPANLEWLKCSKNNLTQLPELPYIYYLDCSNNDLTSLPEFPKFTLREINIENNNWQEPFSKDAYIILNRLSDTKIYTEEQIERFNSLEFQQQYLDKYPERIDRFEYTPFKLHPDLNMDYLKNELF